MGQVVGWMLGVFVVVALLIALLVGGALRTSISTESSHVESTGGQGQRIGTPDEDTGVVLDRHGSPGISLLGLQFLRTKYLLAIRVVVPESCVIADESGPGELATTGVCADLPVVGPLIGSGTSRGDGGEVLVVEVEVSEECWNATPVNSLWPSDLDECAES